MLRLKATNTQLKNILWTLSKELGDPWYIEDSDSSGITGSDVLSSEGEEEDEKLDESEESQDEALTARHCGAHAKDIVHTC